MLSEYDVPNPPTTYLHHLENDLNVSYTYPASWAAGEQQGYPIGAQATFDPFNFIENIKDSRVLTEYQQLQSYIENDDFLQYLSDSAPNDNQSPSDSSASLGSRSPLSLITDITTPSDSPEETNTKLQFLINDVSAAANEAAYDPNNLTLYALQQFRDIERRGEEYNWSGKGSKPPPKDSSPESRQRERPTDTEKHRDPEHECPKCHVQYHEGRSFMTHFFHCTGYPLYSCVTCMKRYSRDDNWQLHLKSQHQEKPLSGSGPPAKSTNPSRARARGGKKTKSSSSTQASTSGKPKAAKITRRPGGKNKENAI
ncbi:hypothetical protein TWF730_002516 [Orbilia blumenaviensis]|uniref:C2H2-type domain-containing protein n=1 Tax=Orbilia blumenaviensis TaxID=1796055 RepID=A0AAV9UD62_9PEZI